MKEEDLLNSIERLAAGIAIFTAVLYFFGYLYISSYFNNVGMIFELNEVSFSEIVVIGFIPSLIFFGLIALPLKFSHKKKRYDFKRVMTFILFAFFTTWLLISCFSNRSFLKEHSFNPYRTKLPLVEIIYNTPLINSNISREVLTDIIDTSENQDSKRDLSEFEGKELTISGIYQSAPEYKGTLFQDEDTFKDSLGNFHFINTFKLFFESSSSYYLLPTNDICSVQNTFDGRFVLEVGDELIEVNDSFTFGESVNICGLMVLPKTNVESLKYLEYSKSWL